MGRDAVGASLIVAGRQDGIRPAAADEAVTAGVQAYRNRMRRYARMPELDIWYDGVHADSLIGYYEPADRARVSVYIEKQQERRTSRGALAKLTVMANGRPRITEEPPVRVRISDDEKADLVDHLLAEYRLTLQEDNAPCSTASPRWTSCGRSWGWEALACGFT